MSSFHPSISFRQDSSGKFADTPSEYPPGTLARSTRIILLIHGYNNSPDAAAEAYAAFTQVLGDTGPQLMGVYWPGSNWTNVAYYMASIGNARESAKRLAQVLRLAARGRPRLSLGIIAHSMGCRLTLELARELRETPEPGLVLEGVVLMAAAVPMFTLDPSGHLRGLIAAPPGQRLRVHSAYSDNDWVLKFAFRIGQSLAPGPEGLLPVALGSRPWRDSGGRYSGAISQADADGAGHGDYWGKAAKTRHIAIATAAAAKQFLNLAQAPPREIPSRPSGERPVLPPRSVASGRQTPVRDALPARRVRGAEIG